MAADSAASDDTTGIKQPVNKIREISGCTILYGASGDVGLQQKIDDGLATLNPKPRLRNTHREIKRLIVTEQSEAVELHAPYPAMGFNTPPIAVYLFVGIHNGKPWILEVEKDGRDTLYDDRLGNFAAIGSGKPWAEAVFRPHLRTERNLELGKVFAYRVLDDSINLAAAYLAKPIHMFSVSLDGAVQRIDEGELEKIAETCETWRELERETVGVLLSSQGPEPSEPQIPKPE